MNNLFQVIFEDPELLVINKPAGLVCHPTKGDEYSSLISRVRLYLGTGSHPQLVNRLDRETSGLTVLAKSESAARQLRRLWEQRHVRKEYQAIVHGHVRDQAGSIVAPTGKDESSKVAIKDCVRKDGVSAQTDYQVEKRFTRCLSSASEPEPFSLLRVVPLTGRKHQIRIHLAYLGHSVVGDKLYGGDEDLYLALVEDRLTPEQRRRLIFTHHALHACCLQFAWAGRMREFLAEPEDWFLAFVEGNAFVLPVISGPGLARP